jgi:hypothetical protein
VERDEPPQHASSLPGDVAVVEDPSITRVRYGTWIVVLEEDTFRIRPTMPKFALGRVVYRVSGADDDHRDH